MTFPTEDESDMPVGTQDEGKPSSMPSLSLTMKDNHDITILDGDKANSMAKKGRLEQLRRYIVHHILNYSFFSLLLLALGPLLFFGSFSATQSLMTTVNSLVGYLSLGVLYGVFAFCNFIAPSVEHAFGPKLILVTMSSGYVVYVLAAGFSGYVPILISSAYLGIAAGLWWVAHGDYLNRISNSSNRGLYSGVFFAIFSLNGSLGNFFTGMLKLSHLPYFWIFMILAGVGAFGNALLLLLKPVKRTPTGNLVVEATKQDVEETLDDPINLRSTSYSNLDEALHEDELRGVVTGNAPAVEEEKSVSLPGRVLKRVKHECIQAFKHIGGTLKMLFATPVMITFHFTSLYSGYSLGFFNACIPPLFGDDNLVPWVMMGFSFASGVSALILGFLSDRLGKRWCMLATFLIHGIALGLTLLLHIWPPYSYFMVMVVCGCADASLNTMIYALLGTYFEGSQAAYAFAAFKFVQSISASASAIGGAFLGGRHYFWIIQTIMGTLWILAFVSYLLLECIIKPVDGHSICCRPRDHTKKIDQD